MLAKKVVNLSPEDALFHAILIAGSIPKLAAMIGATRQGISKWKRAPAERVLAIEKATGISRHLLRPDLYPQEDVAADIMKRRQKALRDLADK